VEIDAEYQNIIRKRSELIDNYIVRSLDNEVSEEMIDAVKYLPMAGGKRLRPIIFLVTAEMFGIDRNNVLPVAAAVEALHTSSLIQDDHPSMDDDSRRRQVPSVHKKYDEETAILASNILRSKATSWCTKADLSNKKLISIIQEMDSCVNRMCKGQKIDLDMEDKKIINEEEYINMVVEKTASIYETATQIASIIASKDERDLTYMKNFGRNLGVSFQIIDDILDFTEKDTGKDTYSDIKNNKKTIVTIHAQKNGVPVFSNKTDYEDVISQIHTENSIDYAKECARQYSQKAKNNLVKVEVEDEEMKKTLLEIIEFVEKRSY
jgi:geranylgeranyl diphosphate synthase type I